MTNPLNPQDTNQDEENGTMAAWLEEQAAHTVLEQDGVAIVRRADFWWVDVDGKPSYSCATADEAREVAMVLTGGPA